MERVDTCKKLVAEYANKNLKRTSTVFFDWSNENSERFKVQLEEICGYRVITITSNNEVEVYHIYRILTSLERLLMIFEGYFQKLEKIAFIESDITSDQRLKHFALQCFERRLAYFSSSSVFEVSINTLVDYHDILNEDIFDRWINLLKDLDISLNTFFYFTSGLKIPIDVKVAFLIELATPFSEIIKVYDNKFRVEKDENKKTTLKTKLCALIKYAGADVFKAEEEILSEICTLLVNSRVRIMHIKRNYQNNYLNGEESILYSVKLSLIYRILIFKLLGINDTKYLDNIHRCTERWNQWNYILERLHYKISRDKQIK